MLQFVYGNIKLYNVQERTVHWVVPYRFCTTHSLYFVNVLRLWCTTRCLGGLRQLVVTTLYVLYNHSCTGPSFRGIFVRRTDQYKNWCTVPTLNCTVPSTAVSTNTVRLAKWIELKQSRLCVGRRKNISHLKNWNKVQQGVPENMKHADFFAPYMRQKLEIINWI